MCYCSAACSLVFVAFTAVRQCPISNRFAIQDHVTVVSAIDAEGSVLPAAAALGQLAAPVVIQGSVTNSSLILRWPLSGVGLSLATATGLAPSALWFPVDNPVESTGAGFTASVPIPNSPSVFFRLQSN